MNGKKKGKTYATIVFLVILGVAVTVGTFALWNKTRKQTNFNSIVAACLDLTIQNESPEITMDYAYPITDSEGLATNGYTFTVTNTCNKPISYSIAIESVDDNSGKQFIGNQYIDVSLDGKSASAFSSLDTTTSDTNPGYTIRETRIVDTKRIDGNSSKTHTIRMWLDEDTPLSEQNKTFISRVKLTAGQGIEADCYAVNNNGVLTSYDPECGKTAVVPATVDGKQVKTISSNAFKQTTTSIVYHYKRSDNTEVASPDLIPEGTCDTDTGSKQCTLDMSIALSDKLLPAFLDQSLLPSVLPTVTTDDIYYIQYNDSLTQNQVAALKAYLWSATSFDQMGLSFNYNDLTVYMNGVDTLPPEGNGRLEWYAAANYNSGWTGDFQGSKETDGSTTNTTELAIDSLDLSQATNLTKIENRAFSTVPEINTNVEWNDSSFLSSFDNAEGLTSLYFGNNTNNIEFGWASFAKANLSSLTIYTNYKLPATLDTSNEYNDDVYAFISGSFGGSTIGTLNIKKGTNTVFAPNPNSGRYNISSWINNASIYYGLFGGYKKTTINNLSFDNSITEIGTGAFYGTTIPSLTLPSSITSIGPGAFYDYNGANITIPASVTTMGTEAFYNMQGTITVLGDSTGYGADWAYNATVN